MPKKTIKKITWDDGFKPLEYLASDVPYQGNIRNLAGKSRKSYKSAIELKCIECSGWDKREARVCGINTCPLWGMNRKIFGDQVGDKTS